MHYRINPELPAWAMAILDSLLEPAREHLAIRFTETFCCP
jgi:ArsR family transcriptional regulator